MMMRAPLVLISVVAGTLLLCVPSGILLQVVQHEIPSELATCCRVNGSIPCIVQRKTLEAVFSTPIKIALVISIVATVFTAMILLE